MLLNKNTKENTLVPSTTDDQHFPDKFRPTVCTWKHPRTMFDLCTVSFPYPRSFSLVENPKETCARQNHRSYPPLLSKFLCTQQANSTKITTSFWRVILNRNWVAMLSNFFGGQLITCPLNLDSVEPCNWSSVTRTKTRASYVEDMVRSPTWNSFRTPGKVRSVIF